MRELKLRYFIDLASNIGAKARADAQVLDQAQKVIQGAITGTNNRLTNWNTLTNKATKSTAELQAVLTGATSKFTALDRVITRVGSNTSTERQIGYMRRLTASIDQAESRANRLRQALAKGVERAPEAAAAAAGGYYAGKRVVAPFINDYRNLESATTDLRVAMMDSNGKISKDFDAIAAEAKKLGEKLPGGTKDFMLGARALIEQGMPTTAIANGGLRASSNFGALLGMDQYQAATTVAKVREAHGLADDELPKAADLMQRGRYGFGIAPTDYLEVAKYAAPTYNSMKMGGIDKMRELLAIQGLAAQVGLEASSFGTNYSQMLIRTSQIGSRTNRKSAEAKEVKALMAEHGISMEFFDKSGEWAGNRNMVQQLEKLRPLSTEDRLKVSNRLFGVEAGRPALRLADAGIEGYDKALATIDAQASLDSRIEMKMGTFAAKLEALGGTIENVRAQIAKQFGDGSKPVMDNLSSLVSGPMQGFFERNPGAGTAGLLGLGAGGAYLGGRLGGGLLKSLILRGAPAAGAVAGGAAEAGAAGGAASAAAAASGASRMAVAGKVASRVLKFGGPLALVGGGLEAVSVLADDKADKPRELSRVGVTTGGALAGAAAGAALGSVVPVLGTAIGAILGGVLGSLGGGAASGALFDAMWAKKDPAARQAALGSPVPPVEPNPLAPPVPGVASGAGMWAKKDPAVRQAALGPVVPQGELNSTFMSGLGVPKMDLLTLTAPGVGTASPLQAGRTTEVKVGEGRLSVDVRVSDDRVSVVPMVTQQPSLVRIDAGRTNPGSFGAQ